MIENNDIMVIEGKRGSGKSLLASILVGLNKDRLFYCNYKIDSPNAFYFSSFEELFTLLENRENKEKNACIIIDEAQKLLNSRGFKDKINMKAIKFFVESRKYGVDIILLTQVFLSIDKQIREQVDYILSISGNKKVDGKIGIIILTKQKTDKFDENGEVIFECVRLSELKDALGLRTHLEIDYDTRESILLS